ncbi:FecR family protein [Desertivirga arenae]|uniref:FecR family protein n=1 Tax=Desertivirga arenae TaxID=2810309 RepID=UPI001A9777AB|nr:FecR domain-containing protein [Pedobacter sp. SYSU D00823]
MKYQKYNIEELLSDESFHKFCLGNDTDAVGFWENYIRKHPEKKQDIETAKSFYLSLNGGITSQDFIQDYNNFKKALQLNYPDRKKIDEIKITTPVIPLWRKYLMPAGIAASFLLAILYFYSFPGKKGQDFPTLTSYFAPAGSKKTVRLSDGTTILLNGGSRLNISRNFNKNAREVQLLGEALFTVTHNAKRPFVVFTPTANIKVLGTVFNVRAYPDLQRMETSLLKGSVEVSFNDNSGRKMRLVPDRKLVLPVIEDEDERIAGNAIRLKALAHHTDDKSVIETDWTRNKLTFYDEPFPEVIAKLNSWYGVSIILENEDYQNFNFSATFEKENINEALKALQESNPFKIRRKENGEIIIY